MKQIVDKHDVGVMLIHHTRKMKDPSDVFNELSGSTGMLGAQDCAWLISKKDRFDDEATLHITGRDLESRNLKVRFIKELFQWQYIGTEEDIENQRFQAEYDQSPLIETIKKLVKQGNGHWEGSAQEIKDASKYLSWEIYDDVRKIGKQINRYEPLLHFDGIKIDTDRSSRGRKYIFNVIHDTNVIDDTNTVGMNDYDRNGTSGKSSRYGNLEELGNEMEDLVLKKDRSFTFAIDKMDKDETQGVLAGASALARQQREVIIPEVDKYTYGVMAANAGTKVVDVTLTAENIYDEIIEGTKALDDNDVPDTGRILTVVPDVYRMMKKNTELNIDCDITAEQRAKGVIAMVDGMDVIKMTAKKMPERAGFMISHPVATVAPTKLEDYKIHQDPPGISGELVEGRIVYDAFVLDNKKMAIYYVENKATE